MQLLPGVPAGTLNNGYPSLQLFHYLLGNLFPARGNDHDGFALAERDLELRGEGTIFEQRQSGRNDLKLASLARDRIWVERARDLATQLVDVQGSLDEHGFLEDEVRWFVERRDDDAENLSRG